MSECCAWQKIDNTEDKKIVMQLTLQVLKDMYLFVSRFRVIDLNISVLLEKGFWQKRLTLSNNCDLSIGNFENCFHPF